jgi:diacylglycerol kinase (CTP)
MRESEVRGWNGVVWYLVGTITVLAIFPKDVATLSILLLSWCDTAASTFGRLWGRYTPAIRRGKSLAGSLAAAVVGAVAAGLWWGCIATEGPEVMWRGRLGIAGAEVTGGWALAAMGVLTGVVASASEVLDCCGLDDNVVIPVVSAVGIWGLLKVFG